MEQPFKPSSLSIRELFGNTDSLYKIPQYQRPYKWEDEQVERLWDDIWEAYENQEQNYFLGSIITAKPRDNERSPYADVVDGQQRLTTLMILFCVIRDLFPDLDDARGEDPFAIDRNTIEASISLFGKSERLKLFTHSQHHSDFEQLILKGSTMEIKKPYKYEIRTDEEPKHKFKNSAFIFRTKLEKLGLHDASAFINFLFNKVQIIRIDCKNREFAIKLFQVLNDRGMDLTAADLIKSFLLERLYKKHGEDPDAAQLREAQFMADWREMEQTIKHSDINMNDLFIIYEYYHLAQNPRRSLYDELQEVFKDADPNEVISDIKDFASAYYNDVHQAEDKVIYSFRYVRWTMYWKAIVLTAIHTGYAEREAVTKALRRFYYLYWIAGKTLSQIKQTSFNMIRWVKEGRPAVEIQKELDDKLRSDGILSLVSRNLNSDNVASEAWIKPLLLLMEYNVTDRSKLSFIELNRDVHLEHILPVAYEEFEEWGSFSREEANMWLNSAGNLTLLGGSKNIEASNNPFEVKMGVYRGKGKYDDKNDKITAFLITQAIVKDFDMGIFEKQWNMNSIHNRWDWFFSQVEELLEVDLSHVVIAREPALI
jgi:uncharacterized protein with ParB-like and HNH nuclease domain